MATPHPSPQNEDDLPPALLQKLEQFPPGLSAKFIEYMIASSRDHVSVSQSRYAVELAEQKLLQAQLDVRREEFREELKYNRLSLYLAFVVTFGFLGASTYLALQGHEATASCLGIGGFAVIIGKFIQGRIKPGTGST